MYVLNDYQAVIRSLEGALSEYLEEDEMRYLLDLVRQNKHLRYLLLRYENNSSSRYIDIMRVELDHHTKVHSAFVNVLNNIDHQHDPELAIDVLDLFIDREKLTIPDQPDS